VKKERRRSAVSQQTTTTPTPTTKKPSIAVRRNRKLDAREGFDVKDKVLFSTIPTKAHGSSHNSRALGPRAMIVL